jgi:nucleoid-associated protein EbfC
MMNPFKMLGDVNAMRKQAGVIQAALEKEEIEGRDGNVKVFMNGNQVVKEVTIDGVANESLKKAFNDAIKRSQQVAATKLQDISKQMNLG